MPCMNFKGPNFGSSCLECQALLVGTQFKNKESNTFLQEQTNSTGEQRDKAVLRSWWKNSSRTQVERETNFRSVVEEKMSRTELLPLSLSVKFSFLFNEMVIELFSPLKCNATGFGGDLSGSYQRGTEELLGG